MSVVKEFLNDVVAWPLYAVEDLFAGTKDALMGLAGVVVGVGISWKVLGNPKTLWDGGNYVKLAGSYFITGGTFAIMKEFEKIK